MDGLFGYRALRRANRESQFDRKRRFQRKAFIEALEKRQLLTVTAASINPLTSAVEGATASFSLSLGQQ